MSNEDYSAKGWKHIIMSKHLLRAHIIDNSKHTQDDNKNDSVVVEATDIIRKKSQPSHPVASAYNHS